MRIKEQSFSLKSPVVVVGGSVHQVHLSSWNTADGSVPIVSDAHVEVSGVKVLKVLIKWHKVLCGNGQRVGYLT